MHCPAGGEVRKQRHMADSRYAYWQCHRILREIVLTMIPSLIVGHVFLGILEKLWNQHWPTFIIVVLILH